MSASPGPSDRPPIPKDYDYINDFPEQHQPPPPPTRFRFKSQTRTTATSSTKRRRSRSPSPHLRARRHRHRHHHRHESTTAPSSPQPPPGTPPLSPTTAFRESLFDALADDEGAAFWQGVYGQPIHTYARPGSPTPEDPLACMSDEEYAAYVRGKMWEKTHEALIDAQKKRAEEKVRRKEERQRENVAREGERERFAGMVEESLRRGRERRGERGWVDAWRRYVRGWEELMERSERHRQATSEENVVKAVKIPYPGRSGNIDDISPAEIEDFFKHAPADAGGPGAREDADPHGRSRETDPTTNLRALLKKERIKWHPDKMQQRLGGLEAKDLKAVTAVFQVIDGLWGRLGL